MKRKISLTLPALLCAALLAGCSSSALDIFFPTPSPTATAEPTPSPTAEPTGLPGPVAMFSGNGSIVPVQRKRGNHGKANLR